VDTLTSVADQSSCNNPLVPDDTKFRDPTNPHALTIDGAKYPIVHQVPPAYARVPVTLKFPGQKDEESHMMAGVVGTAIHDSGVQRGKRDQLSPVVSWWMYTLREKAQAEKAFRWVYYA
jgi:hypothetical protein